MNSNAPNRKRVRRWPKNELDDFDKCTVRRTVHEFSTKHGEIITLKPLLPIL